MSAKDSDAIALVRGRLHRVDGKRTCRCEQCDAIRRVCELAKQAIGVKSGREWKREFSKPRYISQAAVRGEAGR